MVVVTLILTWSPFRFAIPSDYDLHFKIHLYDVVSNIFLFIPLGFLLQLSLKSSRRRNAYIGLVSGVLLSAMIEVGQFFLPGRYSSPIDVITNGTGGWLGAIAYLRLRSQLREKSVGILALNLPLMNLLYLLVPLFWLAGFTPIKGAVKLLMILLLSLMGAIIVAAVFNYRDSPAKWRQTQISCSGSNDLVLYLVHNPGRRNPLGCCWHRIAGRRPCLPDDTSANRWAANRTSIRSHYA